MAKPVVPFRVEIKDVRGHPAVFLHYTCTFPGGKTGQGVLHVGPPLEQNDAPYYRDPLGVAILQLLRQSERWQEENQALAQRLDEMIAAPTAPVSKRK